MKRFCITVLSTLTAAALLSGCAPVVVGGAAATASVAHDRRTAGSVVEDQSIEIKAISALRRDKVLYVQGHFNVISYNGIVLLSGEIATQELKNRAGQLVADVEKVRKVHNELTIGEPSTMLARSNDTYLTSKVKTSLLGVKVEDQRFDPTRVKVATEAGVVYLMGLLTRAEADAVTEAARQVRGVQRVVKLFEYTD